jgi:hypothetical protein
MNIGRRLKNDHHHTDMVLYVLSMVTRWIWDMSQSMMLISRIWVFEGELVLMYVTAHLVISF